MKQIDKLIINSPFEEPRQYWKYDAKTRSFDLVDGRRPAGYVIASESSRSFDDPGQFIEIPLVNKVRPRIQSWREAGYAGVSGVTKRLLDHWNNPEEREHRRFFFCQLEAIETIIWLTEGPENDRVGIEVPKDGGDFQRLCSKMATGSGKTIVMAMLCAWQTLNKVAYPQDPRFSKHILVIAPGLTVRNRLRVIDPNSPENYYKEFNVVPAGLLEKLRQGKVLIRNWHALNWDTEERIARRKSVDKRGAKSDEAYVREVLGEMANAKNLIVINDEAHHAWRYNPETKGKISKEDIEEATKWIGGLDRIHKARGIHVCFDFSATPFAPSGKASSEEALFDWIVSDFGLNDAIESGLVKTPRVVVRTDSEIGKNLKPKLYHIYNDPEVRASINKKAEEHEPLPDLVHNAYYLLGKDWLETKKEWEQKKAATPPVMITVANRTETAARVRYAFEKKKIKIEELTDSSKLLHIDSKVLDEAESKEEEIDIAENGSDDDAAEDAPVKKKTKTQIAEELRRKVDTIGRVGELGEQIQKVISVGMLSEGWDAKTVTHIMGLRAFSSQLLCEQVVGRGLRRTSYEINPETKLFDPEYVNIFGVPFTFLPHEDTEGVIPPPPTPKIPIEPVAKKKQFEIVWPNVIRIDHVYTPELKLDVTKVNPLQIDAYKTATLAELAPVIEGKPDVSKLSRIQLDELANKFRMQRIVFETAAEIYEQIKPSWKGQREYLLAQVIRIVESFMNSDKIEIIPPLFGEDDINRRLVLTLNMRKVMQHIWQEIRFENTESIVPIFDQDNPIRSTGDMRTWYTSKPCEVALKSHINLCVFDSKWEASEAFELDRNENVVAWAKNDHLGFEIAYVFEGIVHKYRPDFLIRLKNGSHLVLETKGQDTQKDKTKREFLDEWVKAVNSHGGFGKWAWAVSTNPKDVEGIILRTVG